MCVLFLGIMANELYHWLNCDAVAVRACTVHSLHTCCDLERDNRSFKLLISRKCKCWYPIELYQSHVYCRGQELSVGDLHKYKLSAIVAQLTIAVVRYGMDTPQKCPFLCGIWPHLTHGSLGPPRVFILIDSAVITQLTVECPYTLQRFATFPQKTVLSPWSICTGM